MNIARTTVVSQAFSEGVVGDTDTAMWLALMERIRGIGKPADWARETGIPRPSFDRWEKQYKSEKLVKLSPANRAAIRTYIASKTLEGADPTVVALDVLDDLERRIAELRAGLEDAARRHEAMLASASGALGRQLKTGSQPDTVAPGGQAEGG